MAISVKAAEGLVPPSSLLGKTSSCRCGGRKRGGGDSLVAVVLLLVGDEAWLSVLLAVGCRGELEGEQRVCAESECWSKSAAVCDSPDGGSCCELGEEAAADSEAEAGASLRFFCDEAVVCGVVVERLSPALGLWFAVERMLKRSCGGQASS